MAQLSEIVELVEPPVMSSQPSRGAISVNYEARDIAGVISAYDWKVSPFDAMFVFYVLHVRVDVAILDNQPMPTAA